MPELRPYQSAFVADIRAAYTSGHRSVMGVLPTGGGKTFCFSYMARTASERGLRVGIVAHRVELLAQISAALTAWDVPHGFIAPRFPPNPFCRVQVCSVQALARRSERLRDRPFDLLIVDEAHHAAQGTSWGQVIALHADKRVLGVTATPQRLSGEPLSAFQAMVQGPSTAELIRLGALSPYAMFAPPTPDLQLATLRRRGGDYAAEELAEAVDKPSITGDAVEHYRRHCEGRRAIAFCVGVDHARHVAARMGSELIPAESIDGGMDPSERSAAVARFRAGETLVLTAADLVSEGFDLPAIEAAILLRPTASLGLYLQQVGRALRPYPGKDRAIILDHVGNCMAHGLPDEEREWSLEGRPSRKRGEVARLPPVTRCERCFHVAAVFTVCPSCGHVRVVEARAEPEQREGELQEVDAAQMVRDRKREQGQATTLRDLIAVGKRRNMRQPEAWARHVLAGRARG